MYDNFMDQQFFNFLTFSQYRSKYSTRHSLWSTLYMRYLTAYITCKNMLFRNQGSTTERKLKKICLKNVLIEHYGAGDFFLYSSTDFIKFHFEGHSIAVFLFSKSYISRGIWLQILHFDSITFYSPGPRDFKTVFIEFIKKELKYIFMLSLFLNDHLNTF